MYTYRHFLALAQCENDVQVMSWKLSKQVLCTSTFACLPASRGTLYFVCEPLISSLASMGRSLALKSLARTILMVVFFAFIRTNLSTEFSGCFSKNKMTHVLQPMVTSVPLSLAIGSSSVPLSCLKTTQYFAGDGFRRESRIEICVTSTNLELTRKNAQTEQGQDTNLTERRHHWRLSWWSMGEFKLPTWQ